MTNDLTAADLAEDLARRGIRLVQRGTAIGLTDSARALLTDADRANVRRLFHEMHPLLPVEDA